MKSGHGSLSWKRIVSGSTTSTCRTLAWSSVAPAPLYRAQLNVRASVVSGARALYDDEGQRDVPDQHEGPSQDGTRIHGDHLLVSPRIGGKPGHVKREERGTELQDGFDHAFDEESEESEDAGEAPHGEPAALQHDAGVEDRQDDDAHAEPDDDALAWAHG